MTAEELHEALRLSSISLDGLVFSAIHDSIGVWGSFNNALSAIAPIDTTISNERITFGGLGLAMRIECELEERAGE